jgi:thioesterase domain-containing protein
LVIYDIPGNHMAMVEEPHARVLAESLGLAMGHEFATSGEDCEGLP